MKQLETLKEKVLQAKDFRDPWNYFFDLFDGRDENSKIFDMGAKVSNPDLENILEKVGQRSMPNKKVKATNFLLIHIKDQQFYHGSFAIGGSLASFMFFEDIDVGMVALTSVLRGGEMMFGRFSMTEVMRDSPDLSKLSMN